MLFYKCRQFFFIRKLELFVKRSNLLLPTIKFETNDPVPHFSSLISSLEHFILEINKIKNNMF